MLALGGVALTHTAIAQPEGLTSTNDKKVWVSIGSDAYSLINQKYTSKFSLTQPTLHNASHGGVAVVQIPESQIDALSEFMHDKFNRCGGFVFHESFNEAQSYAAIPAQLTPSVLIDYTIDNSDGVNALFNKLSSSNLSSTVNTLSNYHNRYYTSQTGVDASNWIKNKWANISSGRSDISVESYNHSWNQSSVIATITGTTKPNEIVIIGGHLDSINSGNTSGRAPGADDNASGIAVITETLRAIVASGFKPERTIKIMGYAAEEVGLRGSKAIAQSYKSSGKNVVGVAQFDMSGYKGTQGKDIVFMTDYTNAAQTQFMKQLIDTYMPGVNYGSDRCGYGCSDHASWHNQGYPAAMPFESNMGDINSRIHTSNDSSFNESHSFNFVKLSSAFVAELAKGGTGSTPPPPPPPPGGNELENGVSKTGLSANKGSDLKYTFKVPSGATNIKFEMSGGSGDADLYVKFGSAPTDSSYDCRPYKNGNAETCTGSQTGGTYYLRLKAYSTFSGVSIKASYSDDTNPGTDPINRTENNVSVTRGQWTRFTQILPAGYANLKVTTSGGTGDADLYVRKGAQSTQSSYDCRPYKNGNAETCSFNSPAADTWYIDLYGYSSASGVTLKIEAQPK